MTDRQAFEIVGPGPKTHREYVGWRYGYADAKIELLNSEERIWEIQAIYEER